MLLPNGKIALGKLAQALMYGATTISIEGNFDDALRIVRELGETGQVEVVNSVNPVRPAKDPGDATALKTWTFEEV